MSDTLELGHFDPDLIQRLGRLDLIARHIADGLTHGAHRSRRRGFSTEFSDFKPYVPGDDPRLLEWRIYARTERLFVRRFEAETSLEVMLLLDATASMAWRWGERVSKLEYGANLLAALACLHLRQHDQVGLLACDALTVSHLPPRSRTTQLDAILGALGGLRPGRGDAFALMAETLTAVRRHRGRLIACTDLEEDDGRLTDALAQLAGLGDEVVVFHLLDRAEVELPFTDCTHLRDAETGELLPVNLPGLRRSHAAAVAAFRNRWRRRCDEWGVLYQPIDTGMDYADVLLAFGEAWRHRR